MNSLTTTHGAGQDKITDYSYAGRCRSVVSCFMQSIVFKFPNVVILSASILALGLFYAAGLDTPGCFSVIAV